MSEEITRGRVMEIPKQLQREEFRFIPLEGKIPKVKNWTEFNFTWDHPYIQNHIENGGNYGVVCGYGGLVVIDVDFPKDPKLIPNFERVVQEIGNRFPPTFTVKTGGGGYHFYFKTLIFTHQHTKINTMETNYLNLRINSVRLPLFYLSI